MAWKLKNVGKETLSQGSRVRLQCTGRGSVHETASARRVQNKAGMVYSFGMRSLAKLETNTAGKPVSTGTLQGQ